MGHSDVHPVLLTLVHGLDPAFQMDAGQHSLEHESLTSHTPWTLWSVGNLTALIPLSD